MTLYVPLEFILELEIFAIVSHSSNPTEVIARKTGRFSGQLLRLQLQLFPEIASYQTVLPLFGRNCRDMLSDQVFLHEIGQFLHRREQDHIFQFH